MSNVKEVPTVELTAVELLRQEQADAIARANNLELEIAQAEQAEVLENMHKIDGVLLNLKTQFGELFETVIKEKYQAEKVAIILSTPEEIDDYTRFATLVERGYKMEGGNIIGKRGDVINAPTINSQLKDETKVLMNRPKFIKMWLKFK